MKIKNCLVLASNDIVENYLVIILTGMSTKCGKLLGLVPSVLCQKPHLDITDVVEQYKGDLPSPELIGVELGRWKRHYMAMAPDKRPSSCSQAIKECDRDTFPNIHTLLRIVCTMPVTSCECERSCSVLRRLSSYMRASMGQDRLSSLALIHIHYDHCIDLDEVVDTFAKVHPRKLEFQNIIYSTISTD